jgi:hypothetical protein
MGTADPDVFPPRLYQAFLVVKPQVVTWIGARGGPISLLVNGTLWKTVS